MVLSFTFLLEYYTSKQHYLLGEGGVRCIWEGEGYWRRVGKSSLGLKGGRVWVKIEKTFFCILDASRGWEAGIGRMVCLCAVWAGIQLWGRSWHAQVLQYSDPL